MFTGFASENTPAIQVWDFFRTFASTSAIRSISLADDCAPIQYFRTGATTTEIQVFLPTAPIEGKQIKIINNRYATNVQKLLIVSSDARGDGTFSIVAYLGPGQSIDFCYSKNCISFGTSTGTTATGWISLNQGPASSANYYSVALGGNNNVASGNTSCTVGGSGVTASGLASAVISGQNNTASADNSTIVGGTNNTASGTYGFVGGGFTNVANSGYSAVIGGSYGTTRSIEGNTVLPASGTPIQAKAGVQQSGLLVLGVSTTDATAAVLRSNSSVASTTNQVILPNNSAYVFQGTCIANVTGGSTTSGWKFEGVIKRGANAASTTLVAAVTPTVIAQDVAAATWALAITADTTNGGIKVEVTGAAATTIRWVSRIETTEVTF